MLTFKKIEEANTVRQNDVYSSVNDHVDITYFTTALAGEVGELCNFVKKEVRSKLQGKPCDFSQEIEDEVADVLTYLMLFAKIKNIDVEKAFIKKFNEVSSRVNSHVYLKGNGDIDMRGLNG